MATRDEKDTTRARANILREFLSRSEKSNPFQHEEIDLCLSCKGCKSECPSNVDMAKLKTEWQHQTYQMHGVPWRIKMIANYSRSIAFFERFPWLYHLTRNFVKPVWRCAKARSIPSMTNRSLRFWYKKRFHSLQQTPKKKIYFFFDEFTNYTKLDYKI